MFGGDVTCILPTFLLIVSVSPCATWDRAQIEWEMARTQWWITHDILDKKFQRSSYWPNPLINELDGWTLIEHTTSFPSQRGVLLDGLIDTDTKTIQFNKDSKLFPLAHEFAHFIGYKHQQPYGTLWHLAGHGGLFGVNTLDIFTFTLWVLLCDSLYPGICEQVHQYSPTSIFEGVLRDPKLSCLVQ